jgi:hypothetical protein
MLTSLVLATLLLIGCTKPAANESANAFVRADLPVLTVYYFHRTIRCPSCEKIEALTQQAVEGGFVGALAGGATTWRVVNIDLPENKHFEDDYQLRMQSVIVSRSQDGKEVRWKNLDKVWDLLDDDAGFIRYVQDEIRAFEQGS